MQTARYAVLGVPLEFATNAPALAALAEDAFGEWGAPGPQTALDGVRLELSLHDAPESFSEGGRPAPLFWARDGYFRLTIGQSRGFADRAAGFAAGFVTPALLADPLFVQVAFIESLGHYLVSRYRPATLHAAGLVHGDRCVLLTGSNGAGKSTLAYACLRAGFRLLAEDVVFAASPSVEREALRLSPQPSALSPQPPLEVWGSPWRMHLLPDALRFFPELAGAECVPLLNGEAKLRIRVRTVRPDAAVTHAPVWGVLSLSRAAGPESCLLPADSARVRRALTHFKGDPPLDLVALHAAADRLLAGRAAHLEVGSDLDGAVERVRRWVETPCTSSASTTPMIGR